MIELGNGPEKRTVKISGGKGKIDDVEEALEIVGDVDEKRGTISQLFNARMIAGKTHLIHASKMTLESLDSGNSFADDPSIELTCWVAGLRQINKAIDRVGIKEGQGEIAAVTIGKNENKVAEAQKKIFEKLGIKKDKESLKITEKKIEKISDAFSFSKEQLDVSNLEDLIVEEVALLSLEK